MIRCTYLYDNTPFINVTRADRVYILRKEPLSLWCNIIDRTVTDVRYHRAVLLVYGNIFLEHLYITIERLDRQQVQ